MIALGLDIGKTNTSSLLLIWKHMSLLDSQLLSRTTLLASCSLKRRLKPILKTKLKLVWKDTGHYHFNLLWYLLDKGYNVYLINPVTTDAERKLRGHITKNDELDSKLFAELLGYPEKMKLYRKADKPFFELNDIKSLTSLHSSLTEALNPIGNKIQKSLDVLFLNLIAFSAPIMENIHGL